MIHAPIKTRLSFMIETSPKTDAANEAPDTNINIDHAITRVGIPIMYPVCTNSSSKYTDTIEDTSNSSPTISRFLDAR